MTKKRSRTGKFYDNEDWCFVCKDGGDLILCDHLFCKKSYHPECVGKDASFFNCANSWSCGSELRMSVDCVNFLSGHKTEYITYIKKDCHHCSVCQKPSSIYCYCCTTSFCETCYKDAEFLCIRINKGFCRSCLRLIHFVEEEVEYDLDGEPIDPYDKYSDEWFFKDYWDVLKKEEGLDLKLIHSSEPQSDKVLLRESVHDPEKNVHPKEVAKLDTNSESRPMAKREALEFVGWASKPLVEFLQLVGEDKTKQLPLLDLHNIISRYIDERNLYDPNIKKVVCDDKLQSIFETRMIYKSRVYPLLELHCVDRLDKDTVDDESSNRWRRKRRGSSAFSSKQNTLTKESKHLKASQSPHEQGPSVHKSKSSLFASIVPENMKLVYLRRSLVEELVKETESFEEKVVGSFVDVKVDKRKCNYQLLPVTGVKKSSADSEVLLEVATLPEPVSISMLCDTNFFEQDLEVLHQKVKSGILGQPTVVDLENKARTLHHLLTKDWIKCELIRLNRWIDHTNEKGRRAEMLKAMKQRDQLMKQPEQEKLLSQIPKVIAEQIDVETDFQEGEDK